MSRHRQPQVLEIEPPSELHFKGPFSEVVTSHLKLTNPSSQRVCFKVKTTAPRRYCVRPNSGFVEPSGHVNVSVMLQPMDSDSQDKGKHKFMVQSMFAPEKVDDVEKLWQDADQADLMDSKLRCVFEEENENKNQSSSEAPPSIVPASVQQSLQAPDLQAELKSIMEECKRLQSENAKLKQLYDEAKSKPSPASSENNKIQKNQQFTLFIILAFIMGVLLGYILL
ncbi:vesicle-associated membrane protein-associated protein B-like isoform X2 [Clavelina lepadiformis]|uniref:vesicle-associated membrane protein-associated protein B-like isoform X2 n=1 Tax=Clavelina lepadiformis TaxID=159417 RepID=UPI00404372A0